MFLSISTADGGMNMHSKIFQIESFPVGKTTELQKIITLETIGLYIVLQIM